MPLPQRYVARCFDPTGRWTGRLRAALDPAWWCVLGVDNFEDLLVIDGPPALLLCVLDDVSAANAARWWSTQRGQAHPRSSFAVVANQADADAVAYWQELGAAAVLTTTLELPLVLRLAERFAAKREHLSADQEHPLLPFWQALPWSDALPKAGPAS